MNGETAEISTLIALGGLSLALLALVGGVHYRLGMLTGRVDAIDRRLDQLSGDVATGFSELREEFRQEMRELREENRRNHQQLLQALAHHSHDPDTGFAIFRIPPGTENPAG